MDQYRLPCPFCGGRGRADQSPVLERSWRVSCVNCRAAGPPGNSSIDATIKWNLHHPPVINALEESSTLDQDAARYRWLRARDVETIHHGGVFAGLVPDNVVMNLEDLDRHIDEAMEAEARR